MKRLSMIQPGRVYVLFCRNGQHRGRVVRRDALHVDLECQGELVRVGIVDVLAVLEPATPAPGIARWGTEVATA